MAVVHRFDPPERFIAGTVGDPGSRTFFLQARAGAQLVSVALEKEQVSALAERIDELLDDRMKQATNAEIPALPPAGSEDNQPLEQPIEEEFRAGTMTLAWDPGDQRVVIEVFPIQDSIDPAETAPDGTDSAEEVEPTEVFLVRIPAGTARAFVRRATQVIGAGRPNCPFCGNPIAPEGHVCVRANGFRRREP
jgi:uncharacterized repeat protein (TIGR03847 family)